MKRDLPHRAIPEPEDLSVEVWRYVPLSQLLSILLTGELPLIRVDLLGDPFEGSVTDEVKAGDRAHASMISNAIRYGGPSADKLAHPLSPEQVLNQLRRRRISILRASHASCWRMGKESEGMWRLYCGQRDGVAMRSTCARLKASITDDATRLGEITYIDYSVGGMPADNLLYPVMFKRDGFTDEHEVRLLRFLQKDADEVLADPQLTSGPAVRPMKWDIEAVLDQLVVSPYAGNWYYETVRTVVSRLAPRLVGRVVWSRLRAEPRH